MLSLQYIAGLIDGDGCIHLDNSNDKLYVAIQVSMTCKEIIDLLYVQFGGGFCEIQPKKDNSKVAYQWKVRSDAAIHLLVDIFPYLVVKKEQAKLAMQFYSLNDNDAKTNAYFKSQMHLLNKRGLK